MLTALALGGLGLACSALGMTFLVRERQQRRRLEGSLEVQMAWLTGALSELQQSSQSVRFGIRTAEERLERGGAEGSAAKALGRAAREAAVASRVAQELRRALHANQRVFFQRAQALTVEQGLLPAEDAGGLLGDFLGDERETGSAPQLRVHQGSGGQAAAKAA